MNFSSILIQGNIISSEVLNKIRTEDIRYQQPKDFNLDHNTTVRDEISLAWSLAISHWQAFKTKKEKLTETDSGTTDTRKYWMLPLLGLLGYELSGANAEIINGKTYAVSHRANNLDNFPVHIVGIQQSLDKRADAGGPRLSPHALVQEYLNNQEHLYALVSNGKFLRLLRDATRLSRFSYLEFNLEQMMEEQLYAEFAVLFRLLHASRMPQKVDVGADSILEFYHLEALAHGSRIREKLSAAVETSIKEIANGFLQHSANEDLRLQIAEGNITAKEYYIYNLRVIYRLLFLMVIEERKLVFPESRDATLEAKRKIYYDYYSVQRICNLVGKKVFVEPDKTDLWQSLQTCFSLFETSKYGQALGIAPLGSGLFAPDALGALTGQMLTNQRLLNVLRYLISFESENGQLVRVNYADLDVEEFGSVYEGLLEYEPEWSGGTFIFKKGTERSSSGSHYTPEELVKPLIQHSLDYLIHDKLKMADPQAGLLSLKVCDVACGSGHILLSAARRIGFELARLRTGEDQPTPSVLRHAIGDVIRNCIYGVDKNPLAVELCKVAMWLEAHEPGQPLNFLDHHIKCGDAIVGLAHREELEKGIADEAFQTLLSDEREVASSFFKRNKQERKQQSQTAFDFDKTANAEITAIIEQYDLFRNLPERTPEEIVRKEKQYHEYESGYHRIRMKQLADAQVAQFFISKTNSNKPYLLTDAEYRNFLRQVNKHMGVLQNNKLAKAETIAKERHFFHWFLEFPEVFCDGGFDCILGNPPFLGNRKLRESFGGQFLSWIKFEYDPCGVVDLVTYFFRRAFVLAKQNGFLSFISTNTIAEGEARESGLDEIINQRGAIVFAVKNTIWPGAAQVIVSLITVHKGKWDKDCLLNNKTVKFINSYLNSEENISPYTLSENINKCYQGSLLLGDGFIIDEQLANRLIQEAKYNDVIKKYLDGDDLNERFDCSPSRWVINFHDYEEEKCLKEFPVAYQILEQKVKFSRLQKYPDNKWWIYWRSRRELYKKIENEVFTIAIARVAKYQCFSLCPTNIVFHEKVCVITSSRYLLLCLLSSTLHHEWSRKYGTTVGVSTLNYSPEKCFESFPTFQNLTEGENQKLEKKGYEYHEYRYRLMHSTQLGFTKTYNLFHSNAITAQAVIAKDKQVAVLQKHLEKAVNTVSFDEATTGILKLRELHVQMDEAVLEAYGWNDIQLRHNFYEVDYLPENDRVRYTIHPDARKEVLKRLLELNYKIHAEEIAAAETEKLLTKATKPTKKKKVPEQQIPLLPMRPHTAYDALYGIQDVVHITNLKPKTVGRWMKRLYTRGDYEGVTKEVQGGKEQYLLNFYSMHEFIVFADLRLNNKIPMDDILSARAWLKERFKGNMSSNEFYPYTSERVLNTIGKAGRQIIFKDEQTGDQLTLGKGNAQLNLDLLQGILKRIHYDKGMISRLYLSSKEFTAIDPEQAGGRPCVITPDGGITIDTIQSVHKETPDNAYVARIFKISEEAVEDALAFQKASLFSTN